jgi:hypothetical protein
MLIRDLVMAALAVSSVALAAAAVAQAWKIGDKVQYFDAGWWDASVIEIGTGEQAGYVKVKADKYSSVQWTKSVRARPEAPTAPPTSGPRLGDYSVLSYGAPSNPPIRLGKIRLASGGLYRFYDNGDNLLGQGRYSFSGAKVTWLSGILQTQGWEGGFEVGQGGRVHNIRLKRGTIATSS